MKSEQQYHSLADIETALQHIPSDDRSDWVRIGKALHDEFGEAAFQAWDRWSQSAESYSASAAKIVWKSLARMNGTGKPVTIGTVIYEAKRGGWSPARSEPPSPEVIRQHQAERAARLAEQQLEDNQRAEAAAARAREIYDAATPASDDHPYLVDKSVPALGLRWAKSVELQFIDEKTGAIETFTVRNALIVPAFSGAKSISSLQAISPTGKKSFLLDGRMAGAYTKIGVIDRSTRRIVIVEGWATGASVHLATGLPVIVAFNAGNLAAVAAKMKAALHDTEIIIAADNDQFTRRKSGEPWNPGIEAANETGHRVVFPEFTDLSSEPTDFNDLHRIAGLDAVRAAFADPVPDIAPPPAIAPQPPAVSAPAAVDVFSWLPDTNDKGKPLSTIENVSEICRRLGVTVRYNIIAKEEEILIPNEAFSVDNRANASLAWLTSWCARFRMPTDKLGDYVTYLSDQNLYNPVAEWITSKPWDGKSRLPELYATITAKGDGDALKEVLIYRWLISAVAAAFSHDGISAAGVLVLQGDQYLGKTKWFKSLVPEHLGVVKDGMLLRPDDKDSVKQICSFWLVELGELDATFRRSDIAALKSFITAKSDVLRRAYARKESHFARRTVFFGSVNPTQFLHDSTGNRRYWTIECESIDHSHDVDMQQLWAEVYEAYRSGESFYLTAPEMLELNKHNETFTVSDPIEERISTFLSWDADSLLWDWKTATEVLLQVGVDRPSQSDATKAAQVIRRLNGNSAKRSNGKSLLLAPPKKIY